MSTQESTCWTVIRAAAAGSPADREELAHRYLAVIRAYLAVRWRGSPLRPDLDDAVQEVFVECFRQGGALEAAGAGRVPSFRAFLYGVVRNVARRFESRPVRITDPLPDIPTNEETQSRLFERTWAQARSKRRDWLSSFASISSGNGPGCAGRLSTRRATLRTTP